MFVSLMNFSITIQVITFFIVSILLLIYTRPLAKKFIEPKKDYKSNTDKLIGKEAIVIENINNIKDTGQVKIKGEIWSASSESDEIIQKNSIVIIERVQGVTLIVKNKNN